MFRTTRKDVKALTDHEREEQGKTRGEIRNVSTLYIIGSKSERDVWGIRGVERRALSSS